MRWQDLVERAATMPPASGRAILGITGKPGAGKSTVAGRLLSELRTRCGEAWVAHVPMDGFHLADRELARLGLLGRKGAPETFDAGGYVATLGRLRTERHSVVYVPDFDRRIEQPVAGSIPIEPSVRLVITEGNYLLLPDQPWAAVRAALDEVWYCELEDAERLRRLVARHVEYGKHLPAADAWARGTDERNAGLIAATRSAADIVVSVGQL
jgi:pantothenate kinase